MIQQVLDGCDSMEQYLNREMHDHLMQLYAERPEAPNEALCHEALRFARERTIAKGRDLAKRFEEVALTEAAPEAEQAPADVSMVDATMAGVPSTTAPSPAPEAAAGPLTPAAPTNTDPNSALRQAAREREERASRDGVRSQTPHTATQCGRFKVHGLGDTIDADRCRRCRVLFEDIQDSPKVQCDHAGCGVIVCQKCVVGFVGDRKAYACADHVSDVEARVNANRKARKKDVVCITVDPHDWGRASGPAGRADDGARQPAAVQPPPAACAAPRRSPRPRRDTQARAQGAGNSRAGGSPDAGATESPERRGAAAAPRVRPPRRIVLSDDDEDSGDDDAAGAAAGAEPSSSQAASEIEAREWVDDLIEKSTLPASVELFGLQGPSGAVQDIRRQLCFPEEYSNFTNPLSLLLGGPPGFGKTKLVENMVARAAETFEKQGKHLTYIKIYPGDFGNAHQRIPARVQALFIVAKARAPSVLFFDECDTLFNASSCKTLRNALKAEWQVDVMRAARVAILGATNHPTKLDTALLSRFGTSIDVEMTDAMRRMILDREMQRYDVSLSEQDRRRLHAYVAKERMCGRLIEGFCGRAACIPKRAFVDAREADQGAQERPVKMGDFETAEPRLRLSSDASGGAAPTVVAEIEAAAVAEAADAPLATNDGLAVRSWIGEMRAQGHIRPDPDSWFELVGVSRNTNADRRLGVLLKLTNKSLYDRFFCDNGRERAGGRSRFRTHVASALGVDEADFEFPLRSAGDPRGRPVAHLDDRKNDYLWGWRVSYMQ